MVLNLQEHLQHTPGLLLSVLGPWVAELLLGLLLHLLNLQEHLQHTPGLLLSVLGLDLLRCSHSVKEKIKSENENHIYTCAVVVSI